MVIDSSILISVLLGESDAHTFVDILAKNSSLSIAAPTWFEAALVISSKKGDAGFKEFQNLIAIFNIKIIAFDAETAQCAYTAWHQYGKGRHPAALNMGDCFSYALAKSLNEPLLYKGQDFAQTDLSNLPY